jgi:hypothetical protein
MDDPYLYEDVTPRQPPPSHHQHQQHQQHQLQQQQGQGFDEGIVRPQVAQSQPMLITPFAPTANRLMAF